MKFWAVTREWDYYSDTPSNMLTYWLGIIGHNVFLGITWRRYSKWEGWGGE